MLPLVLAAAMASASPKPCPADLLVANPRLKIVRAREGDRDNYVVTVDVKNRGTAAQPAGTVQHLELIRNGASIGTQPVPALGPNQSYVAAFRVQLPRKKRGPFPIGFHYVLDSKNAPSANCTSVNDRLSTTL